MPDVLSQEQIDTIVNAVMFRVESRLKKLVADEVKELEIPDVSNLASRKMVKDSVMEAIKPLQDEIPKLQEAVKKVAEETEVKIKELTPPKQKEWWKTLLDD